MWVCRGSSRFEHRSPPVNRDGWLSVAAMVVKLAVLQGYVCPTRVKGCASIEKHHPNTSAVGLRNLKNGIGVL